MQSQRGAKQGAQHAAALSELARQRCVFSPGERLAVVAETDSKVEIDLAPALGTLSTTGGGSALQATPPQARRTLRNWSLELQALEARPDGSHILAASIQNSATQVLVGEQAGEAGDLSAPFLIHLSDRCAILSFAWQHSADLNAVFNQQALVAELNFWMPLNSKPRYAASAFDFTGRYTAQYAASADKITAKIARYDAVFSDQNGQAKSKKANAGASHTRVTYSALSLAPGREGWFQALDTTRSLDISVRGISIGSLDTTTRANAASPSDWRVELNPADPSWVWGLLLEQPNRVAEAPSVREELRGISLSNSLDAVRAMLGAERRNPAAYAPFLRDWVRANPESIPALLDMIREGAFHDDPRLRSVIFYALGAANTPEAKAALMQILQSGEFPEGYVVDAARALAQSDPLPEGYFDALVSATRDPAANPLKRGSMALTLGSLAKHQEDLNPTIAQAARNEIKAMLSANESPDHQTYSLQAAGNAGHPELIPAIEPLLEDPDAAARAQAASALRNMPADSEALALIEQHYLSEQDPAVRANLLASALSISQNISGSTPLSPALISALAQNLPSVPSGYEFDTSSRLLGQAALQGDPTAAAALDAQLRQEMAKNHKDVERIQALGANFNTRWVAPK